MSVRVLAVLRIRGYGPSLGQWRQWARARAVSFDRGRSYGADDWTAILCRRARWGDHAGAGADRWLRPRWLRECGRYRGRDYRIAYRFLFGIARVLPDPRW